MLFVTKKYLLFFDMSISYLCFPAVAGFVTMYQLLEICWLTFTKQVL